MTYNMVAHIVMVAWVPVVLGIFLVVKPRIAVAAAYVGGWLFLPMFGYDFEGAPPFDKTTATSIAVTLGIVLFDAKRLLSFRPHLIDIPIVVWCLCSVLSSLNNGLGMYDGLSATFGKILMWGLPYFAGRLYFSDAAGLRTLAMAILIGGLIYVPLTAFEIRMSPQLHRIVYGVHQHSFSQTHRFGGFRPDVFMQHGLMVGLWMASAALVSVWAVLGRSPRTFLKVPMFVIALVLVVIAVLCKSLGAILLLGMGIGLLCVIRYLRVPGILAVMTIIVPAYLTARLVLNWDGRELIEVVSEIDRERGESFEYRLAAEEVLKNHAMRRPIFGWAAWDRYRVEEVDTATDSLWILAFAKNGALGVTTIFAVLVLPIVMLVMNAKRKGVHLKFTDPVVPLVTILLLFTLDSLVNAMINGVYIVVAGGVSGAAIVVAREARRRRARSRVGAAPQPSAVATDPQPEPAG